MYSYEPPHMAEQKQDNQLEHTYRSYVRIRDVVLKTCQRRWTIGKSGKRGSGISMLAVWHDDDDDDDDLYNLGRLKIRLKSWWVIDDSNWLKNSIFRVLGWKRFLKLFWVLTHQNFHGQSNIVICEISGLVWFVGFYGISTFVGYLTPNPFLYK